MAQPFSWPWGSSIYAQLSAINVYGTSTTSAVGNGALILTFPDAPLNIANVPSITSST